jgi:hypothetical protein
VGIGPLIDDAESNMRRDESDLWRDTPPRGSEEACEFNSREALYPIFFQPHWGWGSADKCLAGSPYIKVVGTR